ncbi:MAG: selenium cofactor biosynthesis protein YqeC [Nitrospinota bacterium]
MRVHSDLSGLLGLGPGSMLAIMGAGGKATLTRRLTAECLARGLPVLLTCTTNLHILRAEDVPSLLLKEDLGDWCRAAVEEVERRGALTLVSGKFPKDTLKGLEVDEVERLRASGFRGVILVKSDGSRKRLLKAPRPGEPLVPPSATHCLLVFSLDAIGQRLDGDVVHRPERVCTLTGREMGSTVDASLLAGLASHPDSYPGRIPPGALRAFYLSQCAAEGDLEKAGEVFRRLPAGLYDLEVAGDTHSGRFYVFDREA